MNNTYFNRNTIILCRLMKTEKIHEDTVRCNYVAENKMKNNIFSMHFLHSCDTQSFQCVQILTSYQKYSFHKFI